MSTPKRFKTKIQKNKYSLSPAISVKSNLSLLLYRTFKFTHYTRSKSIKGALLNYKISTK